MPTITRREHFSDPYFQVIRGGQAIPAPAQFAVGDVFLTNRPLYDPATGNQDGTLTVRGAIIRDFPAGDQLCGFNAETEFDNGTIAVQGSFRFSTSQSIAAIVGGTEHFKFARGTVTRHVLDSNTVEFTYDYTP
jgi:Dirigent-like protein